MTLKQLDKARALLNDCYPVTCVSQDVAGDVVIHLGPLSVDVIGAMVGHHIEIDWLAIGSGGQPVAGSMWVADIGGGVRLCGTVAVAS